MICINQSHPLPQPAAEEEACDAEDEAVGVEWWSHGPGDGGESRGAEEGLVDVPEKSLAPPQVSVENKQLCGQMTAISGEKKRWW